jgi:sugar phosphate isomerase/epimerase
MADLMADLLASFWTLAGDLDVTSPAASPWPFARRVAAAAAAGYRGFGVDARDVLGRGGPARLGPMRSMLADAGLVFVEVELLTGWIGRPAAGHLRRRNALLDAAASLGARHVKVSAGFGDHAAGTAQIIDSFAAVCADAAAAGTQVVLELLPSGPVSRLDRAARIVTGAGAPNGGLIADTTLRRMPCGAGEFDLDGFVGAVRAAGYAGPYGVEVLSASLRGQPVELVARRTAQAAAGVLAR